MRLAQFHISVLEQTRKKLPRQWRDWHARPFFTLVKVSYAHPKIHFEFAVRGKERLIEVGLHCEADAATNAALLHLFQTRAFEILAELGPRVEIERWTRSWTRVHQVIPYTVLDASLASRVAHELARMITVLQPMVEQFFQPTPHKKRRAGTTMRKRTVR